MQDTERQIRYVESGRAAMDECLQQQLNIAGRLLLEPASEQRMELAPPGGGQLGLS